MISDGSESEIYGINLADVANNANIVTSIVFSIKVFFEEYISSQKVDSLASLSNLRRMLFMPLFLDWTGKVSIIEFSLKNSVSL